MSDYSYKLSIKSWAEADRPREKLLQKGSYSLSEAELIAVLIGSGTRKVSAVDLAKKILETVGHDLNNLGKLTVPDLKKFNGIGDAKAVSIVSAMELGRRRKETISLEKEVITSSSDAYNIFYSIMADLRYEEFWILLLNRANKIIGKQRISAGGVEGTVADAKIIFKTAVDNLASSIILGHNHPSGNANPSEADIKLTQKCKKAGELLDVMVLDHLIITDSTYYSFADDGNL